MAATDHPPGGPTGGRRRWLLALPLLVLGVLGAALAVGAARGDDVPDLPALPATSRDDVALDVDAELEEGRLVVDLQVGLPDGAAPLTLVNWSASGERWDAPHREWDPTTHVDRLPDGQVVLHGGAALPEMPIDVLRYEMPTRTERTLPPGQQVTGTLTFNPATMTSGGGPFSPVDAADLAAIDEVRVCIWEAAAELPPEGRPAACVDAPLDG